MPVGDDRYIPPPAGTFQDVDERLRDIWEVLHTLEGRTGTVAIRDSMTIAGDLSVSRDITASGTVELSDHLQINLRPRSADLSLSPPVSGTSDSSIYYDFSSDRLRISENERAYQDLVMYESCRLFNSAATSLTSGVLTYLSFDTEVFDTAGMHSTSTNPDRITIPVNGIYLIGASGRFAANATGDRQLALELNGASLIAAQLVKASTVPNVQNVSVFTIWQFTAGDYVKVQGYQDSGGALNIESTSPLTPVFWAIRQI